MSICELLAERLERGACQVADGIALGGAVCCLRISACVHYGSCHIDYVQVGIDKP